MDLIQFAHIENAIWFGLIILGLAVYLGIQFWRQNKLNVFVSKTMQNRLVTKQSQGIKILRVSLLVLSGSVFVLALMQPQIVTKESVSMSKNSANIFVALDVSKSMLATDTAPNRLERAKSEIRDMLPALLTHRLGLLAFSGKTSVLSPLTTDHGFFRLVLDSTSTDSVTLGGTNLGEVINKATDLLSEQEGPKVLILITDGEDHETMPLDAAEKARQAGVVIVAIGFGSETGSTIDYLDKKTGEKKRVMDEQGRDVISKLDGKLLREIAAKTKGVYVPAGAGVLDLESIMNKHIVPLVDTTEQVQTQEQRTDLFQWFIALGMLLFLMSAMINRESHVKKEKAA